MKQKIEVFQASLQTLKAHATLLDRAVAGLNTTPVPAPLAEQFTGDPKAAAMVLGDASLSARRWAGHIQASLVENDALGAMANLASAMSSVDRAMLDDLPDVDWDKGAVRLLDPQLSKIYARAVPLFNLDADPPNTAKMDAFSNWLASNPHPWRRMD